ncbi:lipocalin-like domain-containing protein [Brevibacterium aurantiacum]|uniref:lipocalin-like domain-containing protein n=1 Tax=Brevibacterium aurantiacum TaxID=273384 RepID=UPI0002FD7FDC|nr:lipocalin-like domain-containing protein [Brevibacterium aurantiacum]MDN5726384.1 lipocalin-like domain-containing protein [Propionibacteriales bacterium]
MKDAVVGVWTFGSYETKDIDGSDVAYPLGEHATGMIMYTADGYMSVQIGAAGRPAYADGALHGGTDAERAAAAAGYLAYTGTYSVDVDVITHHPVASLFPNWEGSDVPRRATIQNDTLSLDLLEPIQQDGQARTGTLRWHRASAL